MCHGRLARGLTVGIVCVAASLAAAGSASAGTLPQGFQETTAFSGLSNPTVVRFAPDGTVFVAEKSGMIKTFDGLDDPTATVYADLRSKVHNFWDRGMLGMSLDFYYDQGYPWVYVTYTHDAAIGGTAPRWGDGCPDPPGATDDGCVVSGRLSRLVPQPGGGVREDVLIEDWCQQYPSHSIGAVEHGPWGEIYVSGGDGASFNFTDWGQEGSPVNPCNDPHTGGSPTPPSAEGGALRSQDLRTTGDPVSLDGTIIRVRPDGTAYGTNPMIDSPDLNTRRIIASGLRNPFRFDVSDDGEIWTGDVGWNTWEEINRKSYFGFTNFGWPCYEGSARQSGYDSANLSICETLYGVGEATPPYYAYNHNAKVVPGESCPSGSSSLAGMRFYRGSNFPLAYRDALFFADYSRDCIWAMRAGADGLPDPSTIETFDAGASNPVWLEVGPDGALYYADFDGGRIRRVAHTIGNQPPAAVADANPRNGPAPLTVQFDATGSSDPDPGDSLSYAWDLDDDGEFDDSSSATPTHTYGAAGTYTPSVMVTDIRGASATASVSIDAGNSPPTPTIDAPTSDLSWAVGDEIAFAGYARDAEDGTPAGVRPGLAAKDCALSRELPHAPGAGLPRHRLGQLVRTRPRVAIGPAAAPHRHRFRRPEHDHRAEAGPAHVDPPADLGAAGSRAYGRRSHRHGPLPAPGDRGLSAHDQRPVAPALRRRRARLVALVGPRRRHPQHHRAPDVGGLPGRLPLRATPRGAGAWRSGSRRRGQAPRPSLRRS